MKERDCRLKACTDGQCQHCKRLRRERGEANGRWVLDKLAEKGDLPEVIEDAGALLVLAGGQGVADAAQELRGEVLDTSSSASRQHYIDTGSYLLPGEMVEWF